MKNKEIRSILHCAIIDAVNSGISFDSTVQELDNFLDNWLPRNVYGYWCNEDELEREFRENQKGNDQ